MVSLPPGSAWWRSATLPFAGAFLLLRLHGGLDADRLHAVLPAAALLLLALLVAGQHWAVVRRRRAAAAAAVTRGSATASRRRRPPPEDRDSECGFAPMRESRRVAVEKKPGAPDAASAIV